MKKRSLCLAVCAMMGITAASSVWAESDSIPAQWTGLYDDVTLLSDGSTNGTVNGAWLFSGAWNQFEDERTYLAFDLTDYTSIYSATLRVYYVHYYYSAEHYSHYPIDEVFPVNFDSTPGFQYNEPVGAALSMNFNYRSEDGWYRPDGWYDLDVSAGVTLGRLNGFSLRGPWEGLVSETKEQFGAAEGMLGPVLLVTGARTPRFVYRSETNYAVTAGTYDDVTVTKEGPTNDAVYLTCGNNEIAAGTVEDRSFFSFALPQEPFIQATLHMYYNQGGAEASYGYASVYRVTPDATAGYQYDEPVEHQVDWVLGNPASGWYTYDVTDFVTAGETNHFGIRGTEGFGYTYKSFDSSEGANPPFVVVRYASQAQPGTVIVIQ